MREVLGESYTVMPHQFSITVSRGLGDYPISVFPSLQRVDVADSKVFDDAYKLAERLEETTKKNILLKKDILVSN